MFVEDLISALAWSLNSSMNSWDKKLIESFSDQIFRGMGLTEKQSALALKILKRNIPSLTQHFGTDPTTHILNPTYKLGIRKINENKRISVVQNQIYSKVIKLEFPYSEKYVNLLRLSRDFLNFAQWDGDEKAWMVALSENSVDFLTENFDLKEFNCDDEFLSYVDQSKNIKDHLENYAPLLISNNGELKYENCSKFVPNLQATDILSGVFEARRSGVVTWDDTISNFIESDSVSSITKQFLKSDPGVNFELNRKTVQISDLTDIIAHLKPCLFIVPGGSELQTLEVAYNLLKAMNIDDKNISVMFRLPSDSGKDFNDFVKFNRLNAPVAENTEIVFISSKVPKPVIKSNLKFGCVINLGFGSNAHYSIKSFVAKQENYISFSEQSHQELR